MNVVYYELPFLMALPAWEALTHPQRLPYGSLAMTAVVWVTFEPAFEWLSPDMQCVLFLAWALPVAAWLARAVFLPAGARARMRQAPDRASRAIAVPQL